MAGSGLVCRVRSRRRLGHVRRRYSLSELTGCRTGKSAEAAFKATPFAGFQALSLKNGNWRLDVFVGTLALLGPLRLVRYLIAYPHF